MKLSTIITVFAAVLCMAGCKYNKTAGNSGADDANMLGGGIGNEEETGNIDGLLTSGNFEDMYTKCTDVDFSPVYFGFDSTTVSQDQLGKVEDVAQHLKDHGDRVLVIGGHCDERGSNEYNVSLGENRAIIIRNCLLSNGISDDRIQTRSHGEEQPADPGHNEAAWAKNRRGEFDIYQK